MDAHSRPPSDPPRGSDLGPTDALPPIGTASGYSLEVVTNEEGLASLEESWNRLSDVAAFPNIFMSFDWFRLWNHRFAQDAPRGRRHLNVLLMKREGRITGILPLIRRTACRFGMSVRKLEFVETESSYNDILWGKDPKGQAALIVDFLAETQGQWDLVDLRSLRDPGHALPVIESSLARAKLIYQIRPEESSPYLTIDAPWRAMLNRRSRLTRQTLQYKQRRLERICAQGLRVRVIKEPQDEPGLLEKLIALERQKQVQGRALPPFLARYPEVFQGLFRGLGSRGWIVVALMEKGDVPVASNLVFRCGRKLWVYHRAYNAEFSRLSPGTMLDTLLIDHGFSEGADEYDFGFGREPYKMRWNTGRHERFRLLIWSPRWTSRAKAFIYLDLKESAYRLWSKTRGTSQEALRIAPQFPGEPERMQR